MGNLSEHFSDSEFACHCGCGLHEVSPELITVLEGLRSHFGVPVSINSGRRCPSHNQAVGGVPDSQHVQGIAADIVVRGRTPALVADYLERKYPGTYGIGRYSGFTHIDVRPVAQRWRG